jgi:hypothetical protein
MKNGGEERKSEKAEPISRVVFLFLPLPFLRGRGVSKADGEGEEK